MTERCLIEILHMFWIVYSKQVVSESRMCEWHEGFKIVYGSLEVDRNSINECDNMREVLEDVLSGDGQTESWNFSLQLTIS